MRFKSFSFFFLLVTIALHAQRREPLDIQMDFESYDPPSTLVVPENPVTKAKFPFIDVHSHQWRMDTANLDQLVREMDAMNMCVMVNLSGRGGLILKNMTDNIAKQYPNRFVCFTNINLQSIDDPDWTEETVKQIEFDVANGARGLKIYKSQGMQNVDSQGNRIQFNGELGIPVLIHAADPKSFWDPRDSLNERSLELKCGPGRKRTADDPASWETIIAEQHDVFKKHPNTTFINAHLGWFGNNLKRLGELLDEMPNMNVGIGAVIAELGRQPRMANWFFEKYQDRILFGKDAYNPDEFPTYFRVLETADEYFPYYKRYHAFWKMYGLNLSDEILKKVYYKNALRIVPGLDKSLFPD